MIKEKALMATEKPRFTIIVDEKFLEKIDDFRFENRFQSRSAAAIELMRLGLESLEKIKTPNRKL